MYSHKTIIKHGKVTHLSRDNSIKKCSPSVSPGTVVLCYGFVYYSLLSHFKDLTPRYMRARTFEFISNDEADID